MADFGVTADNYTPSQPISGIIGKIAKQVVEGMNTPSKFDIFDKDPVEYGKDVEISVYENATGQDYDPKGTNVIPDPANHTLYFTEYDEKVYPVFINKWDIGKASKDRAYAEKSAGVIVETLYGGDNEHVKEMNYNQFNAAVAGEPAADGSVQIVNAGELPEITDEASAKAYLAAVKMVAAGMREEPEVYNPYALPKHPRQLALLIPYQDKIKLDVYARASNPNDSYLTYGVDEVITIPASKTSGASFIVDMRYVQNRVRKSVYEEYPVKHSGGNVEASLCTSRMYALCPLFDAAKLTKATPPEPEPSNPEEQANGIAVQTLNAEDQLANVLAGIQAQYAKNAAAAAKIAQARAEGKTTAKKATAKK